MNAATILVAGLVAAALVPGAFAASGPRVSAAAGFPINARDNAASIRTQVQAAVRRYSSAPRARVTSTSRVRRGLWNVTTTAPAPYRVLLCTTRYCSGSAPAQSPTIRIEVTP